MSFFDMGIMEILLILVIALIIWGPGKIPEIARTLGRTMSALRKMSFDLTTQVKKELELEEKAQSNLTGKKDDEKAQRASDTEGASSDDKKTPGTDSS